MQSSHSWPDPVLLTSQANCGERELQNIVCLSTPLKVHELLQTLEMMEYTIARRRKKQRAKPKERTKEEQDLITEAKHMSTTSFQKIFLNA